MPQQDAYPPPHVQAPPDHNSPHQSAGSPMSTTSMNRPFQYAPHHPHQIQTKNWVPPPPSVYQHLNNSVHPDLAYSQNDERLGVDFLLDGNPHHRRSNGGMNGLPASPGQTSTPNQQPEQGHFSRIPLRIPATCPLDAILLDAVAERNRARAAGTPPEQVVGPLYPNWNHLLVCCRCRQGIHACLLTDVLYRTETQRHRTILYPNLSSTFAAPSPTSNDSQNKSQSSTSCSS